MQSDEPGARGAELGLYLKELDAWEQSWDRYTGGNLGLNRLIVGGAYRRQTSEDVTEKARTLRRQAIWEVVSPYSYDAWDVTASTTPNPASVAALQSDVAKLAEGLKAAGYEIERELESLRDGDHEWAIGVLKRLGQIETLDHTRPHLTSLESAPASAPLSSSHDERLEL